MPIKRRIESLDTLKAQRTIFSDATFDEIEFKHHDVIENIMRELDAEKKEARKEMERAFNNAMSEFEKEQHSLEEVIQKQEIIMQKLCSMGVHLASFSRVNTSFSDIREIRRCLWCGNILEYLLYEEKTSIFGNTKRNYFKQYYYHDSNEELSDHVKEECLTHEEEPYFGERKTVYNNADSFTHDYIKAMLTEQKSFKYNDGDDIFTVYLQAKDENYHRVSYAPQIYLYYPGIHEGASLPEEALPLLEELYHV